MIVRANREYLLGEIVDGTFYEPGLQHRVRFYIMREVTEVDWLRDRVERGVSYPPRLMGEWKGERFYEVSTD